MNIIKGFALGLAVTAAMVSCNKQAPVKTSLETEMDSVSYAFGAFVSKQFRIEEQFKDLDMAVFNQAIKEASDTTKTLISEKDITPILIEYTKKQAEKSGEEAKKEGEAFLEANKQKEGIVVTESGLQYEVISEGTGDKPVLTSTVSVHYHGTTIDGEVFDSSVDRGEPAKFPLQGVIKGWTEGLQLMSVGSKYKFYIPQDLAYGERGPSPKIKPYSTLIFDVELLEIIK